LIFINVNFSKGTGPFAAGTGATGLKFSPSGNFLYCCNATVGTISVFAYTPSTGNLTEITGSPFTTGSASYSVAAITFHPTLHYCYAPTGNAFLTEFAVNATTGALTILPGSPIVLTPGTVSNAVILDATGTYIYVDDSGNSQIETGIISQTTGAVTTTEANNVTLSGAPNSMVTVYI
jgi:6-phosphogluconolactonase